MVHRGKTEIGRLVDQLERSFHGGAWHGPATREVITGIDAATAGRRLDGSPHTIVEYVRHITFWLEAAYTRIIEGQNVTPEADWPQERTVTDEAWTGAGLGPDRARAAVGHSSAQRVSLRSDRTNCAGAGDMTPVQPHLRERLVAGRDALGELTRTCPEPRLIELLRKLDDTLQEMQTGTWGICRVCRETISPASMDEHPHISICLECMSQEQREALEHDLSSAAEVQRTFLPQTPLSHDGWEVDYLWEPFGVVSGDHVDLVRPPTSSEPLHLLLGDVAGKGLAASLLQSQLHALFRALAPMQTTLSELLGRANQLFFEATSPSCYATLTVTRLYSDGRAVLANAGHPRPLLADRRGVRPVEDASIPLGMIGDIVYSEREIRLRPGDTLLLYTDGLTEAWRDGEEYGVGRAAAALRRASNMPPNQLLVSCRADLESFIGNSQRGDDLTMVAVRRLAPNT
jgi:sigma-B regulation protein RsbU (phosphoserine phosphatase)